MEYNFPVPEGDPAVWANTLIAELGRLFTLIPEIPIGTLAAFVTGAVPSGWLQCNGTAFPAASYPYLAKLYPALTLPTIATPFGAGTVVAIKAG